MTEAGQSRAETLFRMGKACFALSLRRLLRTDFLLVNLLLAALPVFIALLIAGHQHANGMAIQQVHSVYENFLRIFFLLFSIFFIANIFGFGAVRQDFDQQTLHYLFLQPIPRWGIIAGKYLAFLSISSVICVTSLWLTYLAIALPALGAGPVVADLFGAGRLLILVKESLVLILGLLAYGAIAMMMGTIFKSGFYALALLGWEGCLPYLPSTLKFLTVSHYLHSLLPERLAEQAKMFEMLGEPASTGLSLLVLIGCPMALIGISTVIFYFKECAYGDA